MEYNNYKKYLISKFSNIKKIALIFTLLSIVYLFFTDTLYESSISLYPAGELSDKNSMLSELSEYTETFGVNLSNKSNYYIPDIISSYSLKKEIVEKKWFSMKYKDSKNLIEYWEINEDNFLTSIIDLIKSPFKNIYYNKELDYLNTAIDKVDKLISVNEAYSGLIQVNVLFEEPQIAANIANHISNYVIDFVNAEQKIFASRTRMFTKKRFEMSKEDLLISEDNLTKFRRNNPISLDTPDLQLDRLRLLRDLEVNQEVFITLRNQLEIAKIEESKERLFINILDKAEPSISSSHPKIILTLLIFLFFGFFISILLYTTLYNVKNK